jgi:hypothetical protein
MFSRVFAVALAALAVCCPAALAGPAEGGEGGEGERLLQWLREHGGSSSGVDIAAFEGMGRGISAARSLRDGDDVLMIPSKIHLVMPMHMHVHYAMHCGSVRVC